MPQPTSSKEFTSYEDQIRLLSSKNLSIGDEESAIRLLKEISYFGLINGYKKIFKDPRTGYCNYRIGTTINDIHALYLFDQDLRTWLLKHVLIIERRLKSLISYYFSEKYLNTPRFYLDSSCYQYNDSNPKVAEDVSFLIANIQGVLDSHKYRYIMHYREKHENTPLWVVCCALSFGKISKMYELCFPSVQNKIKNEIGIGKINELVSILWLLTKFRNVCAHNERLYDYVTLSNSLTEMEIHSKLRVSKKSGVYSNGRDNLYAVLIAFKLLLPKDAFVSCCSHLETIFNEFRLPTNVVKKTDIIQKTGIPPNWKAIIDI